MECQMLIERDLNNHKSDWYLALTFWKWFMILLYNEQNFQNQRKS